MVDVLLANAATSSKDFTVSPYPPLGLAYIAGSLIASGHEVGVEDLFINPLEDGRLERRVKRERPLAVGIYGITSDRNSLIDLSKGEGVVA